MEPAVFLGRPQHVRVIKILLWNVNGVETKLEKKHVHDFLQNFDIISLNKVKTPLTVSFPGCISYKSCVRGSPERGGTVLLVKNYLSNSIVSVDVDIEEQVWVQLRHAPKYLFGFCAVSPADSQYYSHESFSSIQEKVKTSETCRVLYTGGYERKIWTVCSFTPGPGRGARYGKLLVPSATR